MGWAPNPHALRGKVAVVAGATRGAGRGAIAADSTRSRWNQQSVTSAELAREYGLTDADG